MNCYMVLLLDLKVQIFRATEILFHPEWYIKESVVNKCFDSIKKSDINFRIDLYQYIVLSCGNIMFSEFLKG